MTKLLSFFVLGMSAATTQADMKAVVKVTVTGGPNMSGNSGGNTITVVQSGTKLRFQREGQGTWILADGSHKYLIDDEAKTYAELTGTPAPSGSASSSVKLTKKPDTKEIFGMTATRFDVGGNVSIQPGQGGGGGGRRGRLLGGGRGGDISLSVSGSVWAVPNVSGFSLSDLLGQRAQAMGQFGAQMAEVGLVLEGNIAVNPPSIARGRMGKISIDFATQSLDQSPQDAAQFSWPDSYKKVDPPARTRGFAG